MNITSEDQPPKVHPLLRERLELIEFIERLESTTTDKLTAIKIRNYLKEKKIWK